MRNHTIPEYRLQIRTDKCRWCAEGLIRLEIQSYDHANGWPTDGFKKKQWLYIECPGCEYQWSLWKLGVAKPKERTVPEWRDAR